MTNETGLERKIGNFTTKTTFPLDSNTLDMLQNNQTLLAMLGNICGDKIILSGGEDIGEDQHRKGYAFLCTELYPSGEILHFEAGDNNGYVKVTATDEDVNLTGEGAETYPAAYSRRVLVSCNASDTEKIEFKNFTRLTDINNLKLREEFNAANDKLASLNNPVGTIHIWAGGTAEDQIPKDYLLCDGWDLLVSEYKALHDVIGNVYNSALGADGSKQTTANGKFRVPDLRGRFIVGQRPDDKDKLDMLDKMGNAGGEKRVFLEDIQMPPHKHGIVSRGDRKLDSGDGSEGDQLAGWQNYDNAYYSTQTESAGGGESHQNLPPYYVLCYIIKAK